MTNGSEPGSLTCIVCDSDGFLLGFTIPGLDVPLMLCARCIQEVVTSEDPWETIKAMAENTIGRKAANWISQLGSVEALRRQTTHDE